MLLGIVCDMTCVYDAVMLYGGMLYCLVIRCCMAICNKDTRAVLLLIIGRDGLFWPRGSRLRTGWRNGSGSAVLACMIGMCFYGESSACLGKSLDLLCDCGTSVSLV